MEIELKYAMPQDLDIERIFKDPDIRTIIDNESEETVDMLAVYFDTDDRRLAREGITFRIRKEGEKIIGTLKWNGSSEDGMHVREEINIPLLDETKLNSPDVEIFSQSDMYYRLTKVIGDRELKKMIEVEFLRRKARLDTGKVICELSADRGVVRKDSYEGIISEMEIELYSGSREEMEKLGEEVAKRFSLHPENRSKFKQGMELGENQKNPA